MTAVSPAVRLRRALAADRTDVVLRFSLLVLILTAVTNRALLVGAMVLAFVALPRRRLYRSPYLWLGVAAVTGVRILFAWESLDNHVILTTWWTLAIGVSLFGDDADRTLASNARLLVGLAFLFATVWKLISGEFLDTSFFHYSLLLDDRFQYLTESIGGLSRDAYVGNHAAVAALRGAPGSGPVALASSDTIRAMATVLTWWTIAIEAAIAVAFLVPNRRAVLAHARHASLLVFAFTTYLAVPVGGFGALLMVMGLAQCEHGPRAREHWVAAFILLMIWGPLWRVLFY